MQACGDLIDVLDSGSEMEICEDPCVIDVCIWRPCRSLTMLFEASDHEVDDAWGNPDNKDR